MSASTTYTLSQLLGSVRRCLEASFTGKYWIQAETSDLRRSGYAGHAYLELLEKGENGVVVAKTRANIWANRYEDILHRFNKAGLPPLSSGMTILALVQVSFHEQFGLSLVIHDIDPNYSLGEIARLRQQTIARLKKEGLLNANKLLPTPRPLQRLAIISSPTAAGYGDFMSHIQDNRYGLVCYTMLFAAQMQGEQTTSGVISALGRIERHREFFDAVVIIRGGGAVSELRAFDSYELCAACASFPLPIISGIGHERDESVLDLIAHTSQKTPTAVADFIITSLLEELAHTEALAKQLHQGILTLSMGRSHWLSSISTRLPQSAGYAIEKAHRKQTELRAGLNLVCRGLIHKHHERLGSRCRLLPYLKRIYIEKRLAELDRTTSRISYPTKTHQQKWLNKLEQYEQAIRLAHPESILKRGFALVKMNENIITNISTISSNDRIAIQLDSGTIESIVTKISPKVL